MKEPAIPRKLRSGPVGGLSARRDVRVRLVGTGLLVVCLFLIGRLHAIVTASPRHEPTLIELLLSLGVVLTGLVGALCAMIGVALLEPHPWPPRDRPRV